MSDFASIPSLELFPPIPREGKITVAEAHSELHAIPSTPENPSTGKGFCPEVIKYTAVDGHQLTSRLPFKIPSVRVSNNKAPFIVSQHQNISKAVWDSWWDDGLQGVHNCFLHAKRSSTLGNFSKYIFKLFASFTGVWVQLSETPSKVLTYMFPHLEWRIEEVNEEFSIVRRWKESWVKAIAWHPTTPFLALGMNDDSVRCCVIGKDVVPMLRHQQQYNISSIAWRPFLKSELAVGCECGIVIWYLTNVSMRHGKDKTTVLKAPGHSPVNSVEYSSNGMYLLSSSAKDSSVYVWDASLLVNAPLRRIGGGGIPLAIWSPKGNRILAASPSKTFWVWENKDNWEWKRWETNKTRIEAASWHPSGSILLFATNGLLFGLFFKLSVVDQFVAQTDAIVRLVYKMEETNILDEDGNLAYKVGGKVRQIVWDTSGYRVAVMFDDSEMVAVFRVLNKSRTELLAPLGFIRGHSDESPMAIAFQKNFTEGALLTIAWSTGRIQHFPMIFALPSDRKNILHEDHYRTQHDIYGQPSLFEAAGLVSARLSVSGTDPDPTVPSHLFEEEATSPSRLYSIPK